MDSVKHTATEGANGQRDANFRFDIQLEAGASGSYTFAATGTYQVTCIIHPPMNLTITVQ